MHSEIAFSVRRLMVSNVRGRFTSYDVTIVTSEDLLGSSVAATIDLASVDTGSEPRDIGATSASTSPSRWPADNIRYGELPVPAGSGGSPAS